MSSFESGSDKKLGAHWVERKPIPTELAFYEFEMEFAQEIQKRTHLSLEDAISLYTWNLKNQLFMWNSETKARTARLDIDFNDLEAVIQIAHQDNIADHKNYKPIPYSTLYGENYDEGGQFGCCYYTKTPERDKEIGIHFTNYEFGTESPLSDSGLESRKIEMHDLFSNVYKRNPEVQIVVGKSWLYNLPQYRSLFPDSYLKNLVIDDDPRQWGYGSTIWGQFMDAHGCLKKDKAGAFLERIRALPVNARLSELYKEDGVLLPPLTTFGPIEDFYELNSVKM